MPRPSLPELAWRDPSATAASAAPSARPATRAEALLQEAATPFPCAGAERLDASAWNASAHDSGGSAWDGLPAVPSFPRISGALSGLRVLVVEDDTDIRELLIAVLADAGAVVESAESAASGLNAVRFFQPQLLVSDIGMPDEDGYSFMRRVRALGAHAGGDIPAIALTAFSSDLDRERAIGAGFTVHLTKPIDPIDLICAVKKLAATQDD